jgi:hypothetical protein
MNRRQSPPPRWTQSDILSSLLFSSLLFSSLLFSSLLSLSLSSLYPSTFPFPLPLSPLPYSYSSEIPLNCVSSSEFKLTQFKFSSFSLELL